MLSFSHGRAETWSFTWCGTGLTTSGWIDKPDPDNAFGVLYTKTSQSKRATRSGWWLAQAKALHTPDVVRARTWLSEGMHRYDLWIMVIAVGCAAAPADTVAAPGATSSTPASNVSRIIAVVSLAQTWEECSNQGGQHVSFVIDPGTSPVRLAHGGGHGMQLGFDGHFPSRPTTGWFVAELAIAPRLNKALDHKPTSGASGWCLDGLPHFDADVIRLWDAKDLADAKRLSAIAGASSIALYPAASIFRVSIGRVRTVVDVADGSTEYRLDAISGSPPPTIVVPGHLTSSEPFRPFAGEPLVIASDENGRPTHVLVARDRVDAETRAASIRVSGWPTLPAPRFEWTEARLRPSVELGEVITGQPGCGLDVVIGPGQPQHELRRARAPEGVVSGDRVTVSVESQVNVGGPLRPLDSCGHTIRILRAYRTPGAYNNDWVVYGPPPGPPLVE